MVWTDLVPWGRNNRAPALQRTEEGNPLFALHSDMNRVFDDFARSFGFDTPTRLGMSSGWPNVEVNETDEEVQVVAELPGMEEKDVELSLSDGMLTLKGEKRSESSNPQYSERWHGQFQHSVQLGPDIDPDKVNASFKNGVLTVTVAKRPEAQRSVKRIPINAT